MWNPLFSQFPMMVIFSVPLLVNPKSSHHSSMSLAQSMRQNSLKGSAETKLVSARLVHVSKTLRDLGFCGMACRARRVFACVLLMLFLHGVSNHCMLLIVRTNKTFLHGAFENRDSNATISFWPSANQHIKPTLSGVRVKRRKEAWISLT